MEINSLDDLKIDKILDSSKNSSGEFDFKSLAEEIMNKICISNGAYKYHPIEIEFYIYDKKEHPDIHVYPREAEADDLFFHLSGMDICFKSSIEDGRFGGILIRAIEREDINNPDEKPRPQFGGPLTCKNEVLNTVKTHIDIHVVHCNNARHSAKCIGKRKGINQSKTFIDIDKYWDKEYRFLRDDFNLGDELIMKDDSFDFKLQSIKKDRIRRYKIIKD